MTQADDEHDVTRSEEQAIISKDSGDAGGVRAQKHVERREVQREVDRTTEHAETDVVPSAEGDSGEVITYEDGSVSIPILEEELVVEKRLVVKERLLVRKHTVEENHTVEATLARERVDVDTDPAIADRVIEGRQEP